MAAMTHVTGPNFVFLNFPTLSSTVFFLGTCQVAPRMRINRAYKPVMNDLGGQLLPFERISQGQEGQLIMQLNRFDQAVYAKLADTPRFNAVLPRGSDGFLDIGAKVHDNGCYCQVIIQFPFAGTINSPGGDAMPTVYRFVQCIPEQDDFDVLGTDAEDVMIAITATRQYQPLSVSGAYAGGFITYTNDLGGLTLPTPT